MSSASLSVGTTDHQWNGMLWGLVGVIGFSGSLPMTKLAVVDLSPWFISLGRALVAGVLAGLLLLVLRPRTPRGAEWGQLALVILGVVLGFPVFSTLALQHMPASHASVVNGTLPLVTAALAAVLAGERHRTAFWGWSLVGCALVVGFAAGRAHGELAWGDLLMGLAVGIGAFGYVAGGRLSRTLGSWQTICWALVVSLPFMLLPVWWTRPTAPVALQSWFGFGYLSLISMFLAFFAWYRGLALGGIARVGQVQLLQPFFSLLLAAVLLGEVIPPTLWAVAAAVVACVLLGRRASRD